MANKKIKFKVAVDVMMTGIIEVEAKTREEAKQIARKKPFSYYDLKDFNQVDSSVREVL